jgi:hypothetical protein
MQRLLAEAAAVGNATARAFAFSTRDPAAYYYPNSFWKTGWIGGYDFSAAGVLNLDARSLLFHVGWGLSPAMTVKMTGKGSQYAYTEHDAAGHYLDGGESYRLHLQTDQRFPSISSQKTDVVLNADTSVDVYFGPEPPPVSEANWI